MQGAHKVSDSDALKLQLLADMERFKDVEASDIF
jgi:hypothetical protein